MKEAGIRIEFVNKVVGKHYLEMSQRDPHYLYLQTPCSAQMKGGQNVIK